MRLPGPGPSLVALAMLVALAPVAVADVPSPPGPLDFSRRAWGWLVLAVVIACLLMSRWKAVVQIPELVALPDSPPGMLVRVWLVLEGSERGPDRYLH